MGYEKHGFTLFQRFKKTLGFPSDAKAADALSLGRTAPNNWRSGNQPNVETVVRMAEKIGEPLGENYFKVEIDRATTEAEKDALRKIAKSLGIAAMLVLSFYTNAKCETLQVSTNLFLHNGSIVYKGATWWKFLVDRLRFLQGKIRSWSFSHPAARMAA